MVERTAHNGLVVGSNPTKPKNKTQKVKFTANNYKINKTKNFIKTNNILFFFNGVNKNSNDWIHTEQSLKKTNFEYYKVFNKLTKKVLYNSIFSKTTHMINGITFFIKPKTDKTFVKNTFIKSLKPLFFILLAVKLNNKLYSTNQLNKNFSFNYVNNKLLLYQFGVVQLKRFKSLNFSK